jgi:hypothetical protein
MMYGDVAVVGRVAFGNMQFFDATDPMGIRLYQRWIQFYDRLFTRLTTTVHSASANQELRNNFRTRFQIDVTCFRPDEECPGYALPTDEWLALTHWSPTRKVSSGKSAVVKDIEWCAIRTEAFQKKQLGFDALLHPSLTDTRNFVFRNRARLLSALRNAYGAKNRIVVVGF